MKGIIYKITDKHNGHVYIGQTIQSFKDRVHSHKSHLRAGIHHNPLLQRVYNKYGKDVFEFEIIEECDSEQLDELERYWINYYDSTNPDKGYNHESGGNILKKHSPDTIQRMSVNSRGKNNKLTAEQVVEIKTAIIDGDLTLTEIAQKHDVTIDCIYRIKTLENWSYVAPELNEAVSQADTSRKIRQLTQTEVEICRKLILDGGHPFAIAKDFGIPYGRFRQTFDAEITAFRAERKKNRNPKVKLARKLFFKNLSVEEILAATGLTYPQYKKAIAGLDSKRHDRWVEYVGRAKAEGKTNVVIAKELNVHRCTVTECLKEYNQKYANTVVN